ncbi:MAG: FMN-binding glutamate synthase family protein [Myxococcota bacterium]
MDFIHQIRGYVIPALVAGTLGSFALGYFVAPGFYSILILFGPLLLLGLYDVVQTQHSIARNYPVLGRLRFMLEGAGPEMRQYFVESNTSGRPFSRDQRSLMYKRAKGIEGLKPFGTELDVYEEGYGFIAQSILPAKAAEDPERTLRVDVGGEHCRHPYSASLVNISAMSFGALSAPAVLALNAGAKLGGFAHNTGEGGFSRYHQEPGGDVIWQVGTGYFGCRTDDGHFDEGMFAETAVNPQIKMIELKISQGAKPGHGGILPGAKVTQEIADARKVPVGQECFSPPGHSAFSTPIELCHFLAKLREGSGGKPVGFKLCIGKPGEFMAICKAMIETEITPDFITVDGSEGGTGAAPIEFSDRLGAPLREALLVVQNTLVGANLRDKLRVAASGKLISSYDLATAMAFGANWCNVARGFMFSVGCIQAQSCHTNQCPVGVTTQDPRLYRALVVKEKAPRVRNFHKNTLKGLAEMTAACGLEHPNEFEPSLLFERVGPHEVQRLDQLYDFVAPGALVDGSGPPRAQLAWNHASAHTFRDA